MVKHVGIPCPSVPTGAGELISGLLCSNYRQVTLSHKPCSRLPLLSAMPMQLTSQHQFIWHAEHGHVWKSLALGCCMTVDQPGIEQPTYPSYQHRSGTTHLMSRLLPSGTLCLLNVDCECTAAFT